MSPEELEGMSPEDAEKMCRMLENPNNKNENEDSGLQEENLPPQDTLGLDVFGPPSYAENVESGVLDTLGQEELYPANYAEQLNCVEEDRILESKGAIKIEGIESDEVGKLRLLTS